MLHSNFLIAGQIFLDSLPVFSNINCLFLSLNSSAEYCVLYTFVPLPYSHREYSWGILWKPSITGTSEFFCPPLRTRGSQVGFLPLFRIDLYIFHVGYLCHNHLLSEFEGIGKTLGIFFFKLYCSVWPLLVGQSMCLAELEYSNFNLTSLFQAIYPFSCLEAVGNDFADFWPSVREKKICELASFSHPYSTFLDIKACSSQTWATRSVYSEAPDSLLGLHPPAWT